MPLKSVPNTPALSADAAEALELFAEERSIPATDFETAVRNELIRAGLVRHSAVRGESVLTITRAGQERMESGESATLAAAPATSHDGVEWLDELPQKHSYMSVPEPRFLRSNPGKWALVAERESKGAMYGVQTSLRKRFGSDGYSFHARSAGGSFRVYGTWRGGK